MPTPAPTPETLTTFDVTLPDGITLACRATVEPAGAARRPTVVLLHGFPEAAFIWDDVMRALAPLARCVAPNLRGYAPSSAPAAVDAYRASALVADLRALVQHLGAPIDLLVAHDWGGAVAWAFAARHPQLLRRLLAINTPHPGPFLRELRDNPAQQRASAYMNFLCRPDAAALLAENDHARLFAFFTGMGGQAWLTPALRDAYRATWRAGLEGPLNYYRASPLRPPTGPADHTLQRLELPDAAITVPVPTRVLWGEADTALPPTLLDGLERWVPTLQVQRVPQATHWIVHEQPEAVVQVIRSLLV